MNVAQADIPKPKRKINRVFWALMIIRVAVLITCMRHVADAFLSLEKEGTHALWGWLPAIAIDGGLLFMAWKLGKDPHNRKLQIGFGYFIFVEAVAQIDGSARALKFAFVEDWRWLGLKMFLFSFSLPFLLAALVEVKTDDEDSTEPQPSPSTALAATTRNQQPATDNPRPKVSVRRRDNRIAATKAAAALPGNLPTMQRLNPTTTTQNAQPQPSTYGQVDDYSDNHHHNPTTTTATEVEEIQLVEVVENEVSQDALNAVGWLQQGVSIAKIAKQQGISSEGVRKRLRVAYLASPKDVTERIPGWVADNEKFLNEKR